MGKENLSAVETKALFELRVAYLGNPSVMQRINPELPFTIKIDEQKLQRILSPKANEAGLNKLTIYVEHRKDLRTDAMSLIVGGIVQGSVNLIEPDALVINIKGINQAVAHHLLPSLKESLGIRQPNRLQKIIKDRIQPFMLSVLFPEERFRGMFFAGNETRRKNYYQLALDGRVPIERAEKFMTYRIKKTLENRHLPKVLIHEFQHVLDFANNIFISEKKAYATEKKVEELKKVSEAIEIVYL